MRKSTAFALLAVVLAGTWIRLSPLQTSLYWGSDIGEYFFLLRSLASTGRMPLPYLGWGSTYPYFPGMFYVQGAFAGLGGVGLSAVLDLVVPILGALAVLPMFLVAADVSRSDRVGLFAAAFLAAVMPHVYPTSHTAPATLGDLLVIAGLALFVRLGRDGRVAVPLVLTTLALILTHHLSTYFLILMVLGTIVLRGLVRPLRASPGLLREIAYAAFLLTATFAFWFGYAATFREYIITDVNVDPWWLVLVAFGGILVLAAALVLARRRASWRYRPAYPDLRHSRRVYVAALLFLLAFAGYAALVGIPGTGITVSPIVILEFIPFFVLAALASSGRKFYDFLRGGLAPTAWFASVGASSLLGIVIATQVLIPYRHGEYLMIPIALMGGLGLARLVGLRGLKSRARLLAIAIVGVLFAGNLAVAIPPPSIVANWNEGIGAQALDAAYWARGDVQGLVLADHTASTILFGFGGVNGTWDTTGTPFFATTFAEAEAGLVNVRAPSGMRNVSYVFVDRVEQTGVQLRPWEPAQPMPSATLTMLSGAPFIKVFDSGYSQVYWIAWGCDSSC